MSTTKTSLMPPAHYLMVAVSEEATERFAAALFKNLSPGWIRKQSEVQNARWSHSAPLVISCNRGLLRLPATVAFKRCSPRLLVADHFAYRRTGYPMHEIPRNFVLMDLEKALHKTGFAFAIAYWQDDEATASVTRLRVVTNLCWN